VVASLKSPSCREDFDGKLDKRDKRGEFDKRGELDEWKKKEKKKEKKRCLAGGPVARSQ
jgi:hypothetical protein